MSYSDSFIVRDGAGRLARTRGPQCDDDGRLIFRTQSQGKPLTDDGNEVLRDMSLAAAAASLRSSSSATSPNTDSTLDHHGPRHVRSILALDLACPEARAPKVAQLDQNPRQWNSRRHAHETDQEPKQSSMLGDLAAAGKSLEQRSSSLDETSGTQLDAAYPPRVQYRGPQSRTVVYAVDLLQRRDATRWDDVDVRAGRRAVVGSGPRDGHAVQLLDSTNPSMGERASGDVAAPDRASRGTGPALTASDASPKPHNGVASAEFSMDKFLETLAESFLAPSGVHAGEVVEEPHHVEETGSAFIDRSREERDGVQTAKRVLAAQTQLEAALSTENLVEVGVEGRWVHVRSGLVELAGPSPSTTFRPHHPHHPTDPPFRDPFPLLVGNSSHQMQTAQSCWWQPRSTRWKSTSHRHATLVARYSKDLSS